MLKDNHKNTRTASLTSFRCFHVNLGYVSQFFLVLLLLNLNKQMLAYVINNESKVEIGF